MSDAGLLNRNLQLSMLRKMEVAYPHTVNSFSEDRTRGISRECLANILYLEEHALCEANVSQAMDGSYLWGSAKITAKGLDFLADDGGLGAILNVVTVKLHAATIRDLIEAKIDAGPGTPEEKATIKTYLKRLSGAALQAVARDLMKRGLDHLPDAVGWLHTFGSHV